MTDRRHFILRQIPGLALAPLFTATVVRAASIEIVSENDPDAKKLDYRANATQVPKADEPNFVDGQACLNCSLFTHVGGSTYGPCDALGKRLVAEAGWCRAYVVAM